ncbi:hypothetical protein CDD81_2384 [Ophiocordyceps australis]|uniref:Heterokaryon incompatibility domain-containing protein n=1 Tax=Ophiocordyceps australis TaxID=1399860 RepID=A0A2C5XRN0_9HYPO|nr:hypothetical protein CDD81_2384 [Ophiocordyceps australis]
MPPAKQRGFSIFRDVFAKYSGLSLTRKTDRLVAVAGLEHRLSNFFDTISIYGIVRDFFPESLLWRRSQRERLESLIDFNDDVASWRIKVKKVPSWSWMAYTGEISYATIPSDKFNWTCGINFVFSQEFRVMLEAPLAQFSQSCRIEPCDDSNCKLYCEATKCGLAHDDNRVVGWIRYDQEDQVEIDRLGAITLAQGNVDWKESADISWSDEIVRGEFDFVLVVQSISSGGYRRIGVAIVEYEHLVHKTDSVLVF